MLKDNRIRIICGHYGSGKTEFAINYSLALKAFEDKVAIADMDVVNPYFRSREKAKILREQGIKVIYSSLEGTALDLPAISGEVGTLIVGNEWNLILDVGGDNVGARALASQSQDIRPGDYDMFFVINAYRPETQNASDIISHLQAIEETTGIKVTGLINNTHMMRSTTLEDVLFGQKISEEVSKKLNLPIKYISCIKDVAKQLPQELKDICLTTSLIMRENWMS
ncbi:MAG: ATP-binding protein [Bacteroidetes bacterium 4572_77]|nr:MAG: ATP-binding protein [Bacteroidetes bacterium 4572_77]